MAKIDLTPVSGGYNLSQINQNFQKISNALNEQVLFRDIPTSEGNQLENDIDINGKALYNLPEPTALHEATTKKYVDDRTIETFEVIQYIEDAQEAAVTSTTNAVIAVNSASSALEQANRAKSISDQLYASLGSLGFEPPVMYGAGISITRATQTVEYLDNVYAPILAEVPFVTTGVFEVNKFRLIQGISRAELLDDGGASLIGTDDGKTVQSEITSLRRGWVIGDDYPTLKAAIAALPPQGGVVAYGDRNDYKTGDWNPFTDYMNKDNVTILGSSRANYNADCSRIEGGTVFQGRFNVFAHNFSVINCAFDMGKYVIDTFYGGASTHAADHPLGETWDAFAFAQPNQGTPLSPRKNFYAQNLMGLCKDSGTVGHAVLMEGFDGASIDNVVGMYSFHPVVLKGSNAQVGKIVGYGASVNHVIIKSDAYAPGNYITVDQIVARRSPPNSSPHSPPAIAQYGIHINPATANMGTIKLGKVQCYGAQSLFAVVGAFSLDSLSIDDLQLDGTETLQASLGCLGLSMYQSTFYRTKISKVSISNVTDAVAYKNDVSLFSSHPLYIGQCSIANVAIRGFQALGYGRIVIDALRADTVPVLYTIDSTARILVGGDPSLVSVGSIFSSAPALTAEWEQVPGQSPFRVDLANYQVRWGGLIRPVSGANSGIIATVPPFLRPSLSYRGVAMADQEGTSSARTIGLAPDYNFININGGINASGAGTWLSLDTINYSSN